jgi:hypothetical protein
MIRQLFNTKNLAFFALFLGLIVVAGANFGLFNLLEDPYEYNNLYYDESYAEIRHLLLDRAYYWSNQTVQPDSPDTSMVAEYWTKAGGVVPWLSTDFKAIEIEQKYFPENPPNIVFCLVDDWGYNDVGFRSTYMSWTTPAIDRLANEGIVIENYFTHEMCGPSRSALLTGRYSIRTGFWKQKSKAQLRLNETTIAQEFKSVGYRTYMVRAH